jgi:hypothetical protein
MVIELNKEMGRACSMGRRDDKFTKSSRLKNLLEDLGVNERMILKCILLKRGVMCWSHPIEGYCGEGNKSYSFIKDENFLTRRSNVGRSAVWS